MTVPLLPEGSVLRAAEEAEPVMLEELSPAGGLLLVIPHPDDETLGCGMALAAAAAAGRNITVVLTTDGEGSHPNSPSVGAAELKALRARELDAALAELLVGRPVQVWRLGLPDGRSKVAQLAPERLQQLAELARTAAVSIIWTTWRHDPHCDHETASKIGQMLSEQLDLSRWEFIVWGRFGERRVPAGLRRYSAPEHLLTKHRALQQHRSQFTRLISDDPTAFLMPPALLQHFREAPELFLRG